MREGERRYVKVHENRYVEVREYRYIKVRESRYAACGLESNYVGVHVCDNLYVGVLMG